MGWWRQKRSSLSELRMPLDEQRDVPSHRYVDADGFLASNPRKVFGQSFPELPRIIADDIVIIGAIRGWAAKDRDPDLVLADCSPASCQHLGDDVEKKICEQTRTGEVRTTSNALS